MVTSALTSNIPLKILSIALALLLWVHVATEKDYEVEAFLPVTSVIYPTSLTLVNAPPDTIVALISASGKTLLRSAWKQAGASIRLDQLRVGTRDVSLNKSNVSIVEAEKIDFHGVVRPLNYRFTLDRIDSVELPVICNVNATPANGFALAYSDSIVPRVALVRGPKSTLIQIQSVQTEEKELRDVQSNFEIKLSLDSVDFYGVSIDPPQVTYFVAVTAVKQREISSARIALFNAPATPYEMTPVEIRMIISGPSTIVDQLDLSQISVSADFRNRTVEGQIPLNVSLPPRLELINMSDSVVTVRPKDPSSP